MLTTQKTWITLSINHDSVRSGTWFRRKLMPPSESGVERQRLLSRRKTPPVQRLKLTQHHLELKKLELLK